MSVKVSTQWKGNLQFESDNPNGMTVMTDNSPEEGQKANGLGPKAMMLASLAGCSGLDVIMILEKMKEEVEDFKMVTTAEQTYEHPRYYKKVHVDYHFYGKKLNEKKIKKAVTLSVEKYCGVMEMFRHFAEVTTKIHLHTS